MTRNIITIVEFTKQRAITNVFEKISDKLVKLFYLESKVANVQNLLKQTIVKARALTNADLKKVFVVIDPSFDPLASIKIVKATMPLEEGYVTRVAIDAILDTIRKRYSPQSQQRIISTHPLQFKVDNVDVQLHSHTPLIVSGNSLDVKAAVTTISSQSYDFISTVMNSQNLEIKQIFITPQTLSSHFISSAAIRQGAGLIQFQQAETLITINKNRAPVSFFTIDQGGMTHLYKRVMAHFNCTYDVAINLVFTYGSLEPPLREEIIYTEPLTMAQTSYTNKQLHLLLVEHFVSALQIIRTYIFEKHIKHLPFVITGQITKIDNSLPFIKRYLPVNVLFYSPVQYLAINIDNANSLGAIKGYEALENAMSYNLTSSTIKDRTISRLLENKQGKQTFFNRFINRLGAKYDWNS